MTNIRPQQRAFSVIQYNRQKEARFLRQLYKSAQEGIEAPGFDSHDNGEAANDYYAERNFKD